MFTPIKNDSMGKIILAKYIIDLASELISYIHRQLIQIS